MTETARRDAPKRDVVLIGRNDFQNKLLAHLIAERIGCSCLVRSIEDLRGPSVDVNVLALLDVEGIAAPDLNARLQVLAACASVRNIALINADEGVSFEQIVACPGIKGIFCRETSEENFTTRLAPIAPAEGCARWNEINIRPDCGSPRTVQASDCSAPASRPSFSGELILLSFLLSFTAEGSMPRASYRIVKS